MTFDEVKRLAGRREVFPVFTGSYVVKAGNVFFEVKESDSEEVFRQRLAEAVSLNCHRAKLRCEALG